MDRALLEAERRRGVKSDTVTFCRARRQCHGVIFPREVDRKARTGSGAPGRRDLHHSGSRSWLNWRIVMQRLSFLAWAVVASCIVAVCDTTDIVRQNSKKVVMIVTFDSNDQPLSIGSGFFTSKDGRIVTNYHVIEGAARAIVKGTDSEERFPVDNVIMVSPDYDLAVLQVKKQSDPVDLGDDLPLQVGERIVAIGNPEGLQGTVSEGIISGFRKIDDEFRIIQITAPISPGSSGGPLFDKNGKVVGITTAYLASGQNLNFAIPINALELMRRRTKLVNQPLSQLNYAGMAKPKPGVFSPSDKAFVKVSHALVDGLMDEVVFSVQNTSSKGIKNVRLLALFHPGRYDPREQVYKPTGDPIHFEAYLVPHEIPSGLTKQVKKKVSAQAERDWAVTFRVLDYEILPTAGTLEFK